MRSNTESTYALPNETLKHKFERTRQPRTVEYDSHPLLLTSVAVSNLKVANADTAYAVRFNEELHETEFGQRVPMFAEEGKMALCYKWRSVSDPAGERYGQSTNQGSSEEQTEKPLFSGYEFLTKPQFAGYEISKLQFEEAKFNVYNVEKMLQRSKVTPFAKVLNQLFIGPDKIDRYRNLLMSKDETTQLEIARDRKLPIVLQRWVLKYGSQAHLVGLAQNEKLHKNNLEVLWSLKEPLVKAALNNRFATEKKTENTLGQNIATNHKTVNKLANKGLAF